MPIIQVLLEVPTDIIEGLASGNYVRDAAGIIRWAKGTDKAGEIVAHLKEISTSEWQPAQLAGPNLLFPMGVVMAIQIAGFAYLGYHLKQIRVAIESLRQDIKTILTHVEIIREQQWLDRLNRVAHGTEHLLDSIYRPALLDEARNSFREARGEIKLFLGGQESMRLVEFLPQTEQLLKGLCVSFAGEYMCLQRQRAEFVEIAHVCGRYADILVETEEVLDGAPKINTIMPSSRYLAHYRQLEPIRKELSASHDSILGERDFVQTLDTIGRECIASLSESEPAKQDKGVIVVYP